MRSEIQAIASNLQLLPTPQPTFTHSGDNGIQIANQQGGTINMYLSAALPIKHGVVYNAATTINVEYYNLFVVGDESFSSDSFFQISKDCALTLSEGIASDISARYASLTPDAVTAIKTFPSLFASVNRHFGRTDSDHFALFGFVTDVKILRNGI